jgi:MoaA/NifB/PqqE/SkfB family radical SAM enzyme
MNSGSPDRYYSSSKLLKHLNRLAMWDKEGYTFPIQAYLEVSDVCNNRCPECSYPDKRNFYMKTDDAQGVVSQLRDLQVKSITLSGGGEPTCHPNLREIIESVHENGIGASLITNGYKMNDRLIESIVNSCEWIRISLDANNPEIYRLTHGMDDKAFYQVLRNISKLVEAKKRSGKDVTIGTSYLFGEFSVRELFNATRLVKELGVDYIRFKPFLVWEGKRYFTDPHEADTVLEELQKCKSLEDKHFSVSYPKDRCEYDSIAGNRRRNFDVCHFRQFVITIKPDLSVYDCCVLQRSDRYCLGNLSKNTLAEIWFSEDRKNAYKNINLDDCPNPCPFEKNAEFLHSIKQKVPHSNFL